MWLQPDKEHVAMGAYWLQGVCVVVGGVGWGGGGLAAINKIDSLRKEMSCSLKK